VGWVSDLLGKRVPTQFYFDKGSAIIDGNVSEKTE